MAANKERGEVALTVGDQSYVLKLTTNAVCEMETLSGRTFDQTLIRIQQGSLTDLRFFLWATLQEKHPTLTVLDVGRLIDDAGGLAGLKDKIEQVVGLNTEEASKPTSTDANPPQAHAGTGASSTLTPVASA